MKETVGLASLAAVGALSGAYKYYAQPELTAKRGWIAMGLGILAYELACPQGELLSEGVDKALNAHPLITRAAIGVTALHLANLIPDTIDPFKRGIDLLKTW